MNIGFVMNRWNEYGGVATWAKSLIPRLMESNTVRLGILNHKGNEIALAKKLGCEVFEAPCRRVAWRSDVLVLWHIGAESNKVLGRTPCPPAISVSHEGGGSEITRKAIEHQSKWSHRYVYVEHSAASSIPERLQHLSVCIPNAPDPRLFKISRDKRDVRKAIGVSEDQVLLCMMTRITPEKGIHLIAEAVKMLGEGFKFVVAGIVAGTVNESYKDSLVRAGVIVLPPQDTKDVLCASDLSVSASRSEGNSYFLLESLLAGVPVVSTQVGLLNTNPHLAKIVQPSAESIASSILSDWKDVKGRALRACIARKWISENASIDAFISKWKEVIDETAIRTA